ncbi:hypothetical protein PI124_g14958 [Phytophthora idaei]|nr:hypothetical protein PI125_g12578 [Phytophthora idaei]KAG3146980.1 hypothetical protein PI126_g13063 [Phytophthora idaei]KAG3240142.1 hypothetical protein PI124_g14958 [Phytophthora idaei]
MCIISIVGSEPPWGLNIRDVDIKNMLLDMAAMPPRASVFTQEQWDFLNWMCTFEKATMADVVQGLKRFIEHNPAPDWIIPCQAESFEDEVFSESAFVSRHKGLFLGTKWRLKSVEVRLSR